jgi:hypothetical protein
MIGKLHDNKIFACCDKCLLNTKVVHNDLEIFISSSFFGDNKITDKEILENIDLCESGNFFGNKICDLLVSKKIVSKELIIYFGKIPHIQIYKI